MSQNDLVIDNQSFPATRSDINSALQALGSLSSGSSAPATTYANMLWYDTINNTLKMRSEANDQWISVAYVDQSADAFRIFDDTQVVNASGTQTGLIGDQATAGWEAGIGTTESLVSPAKVKAAIDALVPEVVTATSSQFTWAAGSLLTFAHGQGVRPYIVSGDFVCVSAHFGWSVGDKIELQKNHRNGTAWADDTNIYFVCDDDGSFLINDKNTGAIELVTSANWRIVLKGLFV